jgi:acetyltransferase-like isoleucine patch superfamily enzyme
MSRENGIAMIKKWGRHAIVWWARSWMQFASLTMFGRLATRIATSVPLPYFEYYAKQGLADFAEFGYVAPSARIHHDGMRLGPHVFINDDVLIFRDHEGGPVSLGQRLWIGAGCQLMTGQQASIEIGDHTSIGRGSALVAFLANIRIGSHVMVASHCRFYPYNHGTAHGEIIQKQPLTTKGPIIVENDVRISTGAIVLSGVRIGEGAVVGAGSVVTRNVPPGAIVLGNPAQVVKYREQQEAELNTETRDEATIVRLLDGTIRSWSREASSLYGWVPEEAIAKSTHALLQTKFPEPLPSIEKQLVTNGLWEGTLVHLRRNGVPVIVRSRWELRDGEMGETRVLEINRIAS